MQMTPFWHVLYLTSVSLFETGIHFKVVQFVLVICESFELKKKITFEYIYIYIGALFRSLLIKDKIRTFKIALYMHLIQLYFAPTQKLSYKHDTRRTCVAYLGCPNKLTCDRLTDR